MSETPAEYRVEVTPAGGVQIKHDGAGVIIYCNRYPTREENEKAALEALQREIARG